MPEPVIMWFRQDLRLADNPALAKAAQLGTVIPIYIHDTPTSDPMGAASKWWLHHSLTNLHQSLNGQLAIYQGDPVDIIPKLIKKTGAQAVFWNRCYEPWQIMRSKALKTCLKEMSIKAHSCNGSLLWEPWEILKKDASPYKVFTAYYKHGCLNYAPPRTPIAKPQKLSLQHTNDGMTIAALQLLPTLPWGETIKQHWQIGESAAIKKLHTFLQSRIQRYQLGRDIPSEVATSYLSPHLHFGEISPHQIWYTVKQHPSNDNQQKFLAELAWREFSYNLLYHFPALATDNLQAKFDRFPWQQDPDKLRAWQKGLTGYPIIDAGMRELWQTGYMHNRVRMIVASFLVKNCLIHWREGAAWFWDCLVDADLANNSASWQWVAGCGADAAPFFRIFNPITQGKKFDENGDYTKKYLPELAKLPAKYLFNPWEAPAEILQQAQIKLGDNYPYPIVNLKQTREDALAAYQAIKGD